MILLFTGIFCNKRKEKTGALKGKQELCYNRNIISICDSEVRRLLKVHLRIVFYFFMQVGIVNLLHAFKNSAHTFIKCVIILSS